jgi:predicted PurR-regulated permease PerM
VPREVVVVAAAAVAGPPEPRPARGLRRFRARWLALLGATLLAMYLCWLMLEPFVEVLLWAVVLTIVFYPLHVWLLRRVRRPAAAAALSCLLVVAVIMVPLSLVTVAVVNEARGTAAYVQENADRLLDPNTRFYQFLRRYVVDLDAPLPNERTQGPPAPSTRPATAMRAYVVEQLRNMSATIAGGTFLVVGGVLVTFVKVIFVILTMFYLFRDGQRIKTILFDSLPLERAQTQRIFDRTREVIAASVYGVLVIASIQAVLGEIGFIVVGLPSPLLWGVVMFFLSMIPMAGSFLVWVPACLYLLVTGHWAWAIVLAAWCAGVVGMVDNVLRPRLVGKRTRLHELLVFFSVLGGLQVFGALGLVVGPVVVAITLALIDIFRKADRPSSPAEPTLAEQQAALRNVEPEDAAGPPPAGTAAESIATSTAVPSSPAGAPVGKPSRPRRAGRR